VAKWILIVVVLFAAGGLTYYSRAVKNRHDPCKTLVEVCEKSGIMRPRKVEDRPEFRRNCFVPIFTTGTFMGENFDPEIVDACREKIRQRGQRIREHEKPLKPRIQK
jgi:hypothetical protein